MSRVWWSRGGRAVAGVLTLIGAVEHGAAQQMPSGTPSCRAAGPLVRVAELPEGSGAAVSRRDADRVWSHNDSGQPVLVALNAAGAVTGRVRVSGAPIDDWEAVAVGPCPSGSCLYLGDIGDNDAKRRRITVYRLPEPDAASSSAPVAEVFHATYPDGPADAEAMFVTPAGELFIVTKGRSRPVTVYRFPREMRAGQTVALERVAAGRETGKPEADDRVTDGAISPDGRWVVLRSNTRLQFYAAAELLAGRWQEAGRVDLAAIGEPQGEGVAFAADSTLYLIGEGGGKSQPGTFGRLTCTF